MEQISILSSKHQFYLGIVLDFVERYNKQDLEKNVAQCANELSKLITEKEESCRFGHECTSSCGNDYDCPCLADHCCALSKDVCDGTCDGCFFKDKYELPGFSEVMSNLEKLTIVKN